jgi:hypothetical protein
VVEASSHQRLQPIAQRAADVGFRNHLNLDALDDVARIDVLDQAPSSLMRATRRITRAWPSAAPHSARGDDVGMFFLDAAAISLSRVRLSGSPVSASSSRRRPG